MIEIKVNVQLGVTPALESLLSALLQKTGTPAMPATEEHKESKAPKSKPAPEKVANVEAPAPPPAPVPAVKEYTEEDIREAMDRTRKRFEGEDYKDNTESELYKKHHRALTAIFKNIAALLGSDKPSALPAEKREQFINECDALILNEDGVVSQPQCPF